MRNMNKAEMITEIEKLGSDNLPRFGGAYCGGIRLQQSSSELADFILFLKKHRPGELDYLEIGSASGGLTYTLNRFLKFKNIILIDDDQHPRHKLLKDTLGEIDYVKWTGDSQSAQAADFIKSLDLKFDIIFIDADHSYEGIKNDTSNFLPFLKDTGLLVFHDIEQPGVKKWLNEAQENYGIANIINFVNSKYTLGIGVYQGRIHV